MNIRQYAEQAITNLRSILSLKDIRKKDKVSNILHTYPDLRRNATGTVRKHQKLLVLLFLVPPKHLI